MIRVLREPPRRLLVILAILLLPLLLVATERAEAQPALVIQADIEGAITRATVEYLIEILDTAQQDGAEAIILRLNTPGGGVAETEQIVELMLNAPVPIIGYVNPAGASAVSAGTWILVGTDAAAMTPGTTIGSLQPVVIGPEGLEPVEEAKIINFIVEKVQAALALHGRNESLADAFVRENLNLGADEALAAGAIEVVATDTADLLAQLDGVVTHYKGTVLNFDNVRVEVRSPSIRVRAIVIISDPVIGSILLLLGIYGVIFGISTPGHGAEVFGTIAIALGLIALGLGISLVALFLIVLGVALLIVEIATPSFGAVGTGGIISIIVGSIFLAPIRPPTFLLTAEEQLRIVLILAIPTAVVGAFLLFALYKVLQVRRQRPFHAGPIGAAAVVIDPLGPGKKGYVRYEGELWQAVAGEAVEPEEKVYVLGKDGPVLTVGKEPPPEPEAPRRPYAWLRSLLGRLKRE